MLKQTSLILLVLVSFSFVSASFYDRIQNIQILNNNTNSEELSLSINNGEINTYLTRYSPLLNKWIRARGTFYSIYNEKVKFGVIDREILDTKYSQYKYYFVSKMPSYEKEGYYFFYDGNLSNKDGFVWIDLTDICSKENANCNITRYTQNRIIFKDLNIISVEFNSTRSIDPNFAGGTGTSIDPYQITNWTALSEMRSYLSSYFILMNDLNSSNLDYTGIGDAWVPVGNSTTGKNFVGVFDGQNYTISDLYSTANLGYPKGLFGVGATTTIKNVKIQNVTFTNNYRVAGVVGQATGYVINCHVLSGTITGSSTASGGDVGGVVAYHGGGSATDSGVTNCSNNASVTGKYYIGGVLGNGGGSNAHCRYCTNYANVLTTNVRAGGIVGSTGATIINSINYGDVNGAGTTAGIGGYVTNAINNSVNYGNVVSTGIYTGGIGGDIATTAILYNNTNNGEINGTQYVGGLCGRAYGKYINSANYGNITGSSADVGGLFGSVQASASSYYTGLFSSGNVNGNGNVGGCFGRFTNGRVNDTYCTGSVTTTNNFAGGFVGTWTLGNLSNSFATGEVITIGVLANIGGFNGVYTAGRLENCYWDINTTKKTTSANCTGKTTDEMKNISTFSSFDILESDKDLNNGYPYLGWQNSNSTVWLIPISSSNCWLIIGNILFIPRGCLYQVNKGVLG